MAYADFKADDAYASKHDGAAVQVVFVNESDPTDTLVGAVTSFNINNTFRLGPVEEAGNDGVDEITVGAHSGNGDFAAFFTPEWNDRLPTRQDFIGRSYTIMRRVGVNRDFEGTVLDAVTGAKLERVSHQHPARGNLMVSASFMFERHYNGDEWAKLTGT